jgi:hypothetical protein
MNKNILKRRKIELKFILLFDKSDQNKLYNSFILSLFQKNIKLNV